MLTLETPLSPLLYPHRWAGAGHLRGMSDHRGAGIRMHWGADSHRGQFPGGESCTHLELGLEPSNWALGSPDWLLGPPNWALGP